MLLIKVVVFVIVADVFAIVLVVDVVVLRFVIIDAFRSNSLRPRKSEYALR